MGPPVIIAKDTPIADVIKEYGCGVEFDSQKPLVSRQPCNVG